jgi:asparagine synthase (glutamine-hydrolysing)
MCGIAGIVHWGSCLDARARVEQMVAAMQHRGPDGRDTYSSPHCELGHTRLSILDLVGGRQPMHNEDGRIVVVYNGEIYNHRELRKELEQLGHRFKTDHSDTEVLVHGYEAWQQRLPARLNGMFAFAVWDENRQRLFLARDRYGIKPLYVSYGPEGSLIFASEARTILASKLVPKKENFKAVVEYFSFQNLWGCDTFFDGIQQFPAGHHEFFSRKGSKRKSYWDFTFHRSNNCNIEDAALGHREILRRVMQRQTDADVPVMTYLSGGIDSSAVAASAYSLDRSLRSYSCIFNLDGVGEDRIFDEREYSRLVAKHLGIERVELELPQDSLKHCLDATIAALEYPRMGMSYVNYLIAQRVASDVKVVLSGMGGDELHGGYLYRYQALDRSQALPGYFWPWQRLFQKNSQNSNQAIYFQILNFLVPEQQLSSAFTPGFISTAGDFVPREAVNALFRSCPSRDPWDLIMYVDAKTYLHGLLVIEDKLSMAHSLETRVPLLDNEIVDFVCDLPWPLLCDGKIGKVVFRESVKPWVPEAVYLKPKMGFGPPDASWYRTALKDWIQEELSERRIKARGILQPAFVQQTLEDHFSGARNNVALIWSLLCFESWCRVFGMFGGDLNPVH